MNLVKLSELNQIPFHDAGVFAIEINESLNRLTMVLETSEDDTFAPDTQADIIFYDVTDIVSSILLDILNDPNVLGDISRVEAKNINEMTEQVKMYISLFGNSESNGVVLEFITTGFEWVSKS